MIAPEGVRLRTANDLVVVDGDCMPKEASPFAVEGWTNPLDMAFAGTFTLGVGVRLRGRARKTYKGFGM